MNGDPHLRLVISHGFNVINIKSIMTVLDNKPLTNAHINKIIKIINKIKKWWGHIINENLIRSLF